MNQKTRGFISTIVIALLGVVSVFSLGLYAEYKVEQIKKDVIEKEVELIKQNLGASASTTQLTDTIGTFRNNVNGSLERINSALSDTTSTDPGHVHTSSAVSGTIAIAQGGFGTSSIPLDGQIPVGSSSAYAFTTLPDCKTTATDKLLYTSSTHTWSCSTDQGITFSGGPSQATGDLVYASGTSVFTRLSMATSGLTLRASTTPQWDGLAFVRSASSSVGLGTTATRVMATTTIPAGLLGTSRGLRVTLSGGTASNDGLNVTVGYGGTTFYTATGITLNVFFHTTVTILNNASTTAQVGGGYTIFDNSSQLVQVNNAGSVNSAVSQDLTISFAKSTANNGNTPSLFTYYIEVL